MPETEQQNYVLTYEYQSCFDDGGLGHDSYWQKSIYRFIADSDEEAQSIVEEQLKPHQACSGSFCNNEGQKRLIKFEHETVVTLLRDLICR